LLNKSTAESEPCTGWCGITYFAEINTKITRLAATFVGIYIENGFAVD